MNRRAVLGIAGGGGGVAALAVVALLILVLLGKCSLPLNFGKSGAVVSPKPSASAAPASTPTPNSSTPPPLAAASPTPSPSPSPSPSAPAHLIISSLPVHVGEVGISYAPVTLGASGGTPPYKWSTNPGALPVGLALSQDGVLSGNPTAPGDFTPTFRVDDSAGQAAGYAAPFTIVPALAVTQPCVNLCNVEAGCTAACLAAGVQSGGLGPYSYSFTGTAPPPTSFANSLTLAGAVAPPGVFAGPPPVYTFAITVGDSLGAAPQTATAKMTVYGRLSTKDGSVVVTANTNYSAQFSYTAGYKLPSATISGGPPGTTVSVTSASAVTIAVPPSTPPGTYPAATLRLTDQALCGPAAGELCSASAQVIITVR